MSKSLFITGTGTDVGKTYVTALVVKKLRDAGLSASYFKAAVSGNLRSESGLIPRDADFVNSIAGIHGDLSEMVPYVYENAVSPHLASRIEGNPVDMKVVKAGFEKMGAKVDYVTMEGSGGIICPIRFDKQQLWLEDIIQNLNLSSIIVAAAGLGTINSAVLTYEYMKQKGLNVKGFIFNHFHPGDVMEEDNLKMVEYRTGLPVIACVKESDPSLDVDVHQLTSLYE
jgi:dethiobiotin synthetase